MPATIRKRNRAVLDSVISELENKRISRYRFYVGRHNELDDENGAIRTNPFTNGDYFDDEDFKNYSSMLEYNTQLKDLAPKRRVLSRSLSDPTGALHALDETIEEMGSRHGPSHDMTKLLETAGQLTWLHFLSESVSRQNKHRGSEPATFMNAQRSILQNKNGKIKPIDPLGKRDKKNKEGLTPTHKGHNRRSKLLTKTGRAYFAIPNSVVSENEKKDANQKSMLVSKQIGKRLSYNSSLPPIRETQSALRNGTNVSLSSQNDSKTINMELSSSSIKSTPREKKNASSPRFNSTVNYHKQESKHFCKKVVFDVTSESSLEQQSLPDNDATDWRKPDISSGFQSQTNNIATSTRLRKIGKTEVQIRNQRTNILPNLPAYRKTSRDRKLSLVTQTSRKSSSSGSDLNSLIDDEPSTPKSGRISFQRRRRSLQDRKFSNTSMQAMGDASRPSITNPSETFERLADDKDVSVESESSPPPLPERMVSFLSKINAWKATGPDVPRPRARTSGSLPSIMNTQFWPTVSGSPGVANRSNQRSVIQQQQQQALAQGRFFRRKSSFAVQSMGTAAAPSRRLNSLRQNGENVFPPITRRPNLRRTLSQGDFSKLITRKRFMPLVKFRRVVKMVLILLKATYSNREVGQRRERYLSLWASVLNGKFSSSRRAYEMYGISFDPQEFKANTEVQVSTEAKAILSLEPGQRSQQQLRQALASLRQAVEEFSEFPITMQESLARVGRYEHFEAKRVIIRQGHLAENFYFILSGTAVVIILDTDKQTGEQTARTVTFLGKGKSFGELALMYKSRRTATVRCQEDVELLAVAREDFVDIFMHVERDMEPEHVTFLRSLHVLRSWPVEILPANNPRILVYTYVRRGIVLCKDSNASEWIYVIKSGSCRVIKALKHAHARQKVQERTLTNEAKQEKERHIYQQELHHSLLSLPMLAPISTRRPSRGRKRAAKTFRLTPGLDLPTEKMEQVSTEHYRILDSIHRLRHRLSFSGTEISSSENTSRSSSLNSESEENSPNHNRSGDGMPNTTVFVDLLSLLPGDIYGLESCVFRSMGNRTTSTSLVSGGAEVIMINRKFFLDHTSEQLRKRLRREIRPLPSEETLQSQLETKISWEAFRHDTLKQTLQLRRKHMSYIATT